MSCNHFLKYFHSRNIFSILLVSIFLSACAQSEVSRNAANAVDDTTSGAHHAYSETAPGDFANSYGNASQATKGALIGGATGAAAGIAYSSIGFIPGTITGMILGASYGSYIDSKSSLSDQLANRGVTMMKLGDHVMIVVPTSLIFASDSAEVLHSSYSTLSMIAEYIRPTVKTLVKVSAYSNSTSSPEAELALTKQRATQVAKILGSYGVNARLLYAEGYGSSHLVESVEKSQSDGGNDRIEITFQNEHV